MIDLVGAHIVITGATGGIGLATAQAFLSEGARLTIVGRSEASCRVAVQNLNPHVANGAWLRSEVCDLSSIRDVRALTDRLSLQEPIDALISNAGVQPWSRQLTADGVELTFATNVLAHYGLVAGLKGAIAASRLKMVVAIGSMVHRWAKLDWSALHNPEPFNSQAVYARSKAELVLLQTDFAARLAPWGIAVHTLEPGITRTNFARHFNGFDLFMAKLWWVFMRRPEDVEHDFVQFLCSDDPVKTTNAYWSHSRPMRPSRFATDRDDAKRLAAYCQSLIDGLPS